MTSPSDIPWQLIFFVAIASVAGVAIPLSLLVAAYAGDQKRRDEVNKIGPTTYDD